jgi:hypothetical protein
MVRSTESLGVGGIIFIPASISCLISGCALANS